jgi:hypothetical protein
MKCKVLVVEDYRDALRRAWGKPKEYDPKAEAAEQRRADFDTSPYAREELRMIIETLRMMLRLGRGKRRRWLRNKSDGEPRSPPVGGAA